MLFTAAFRQYPSCQNYYREDRRLASFIAVYYLTQCFACYLYVTRALYSTSRNERTNSTRRYQVVVTASRALRSRYDVPNTGVKQLCTKPQHSFTRILFKMKKHCTTYDTTSSKTTPHTIQSIFAAIQASLEAAYNGCFYT
ncbi:Hypothetical_protein [Hexamita inflata]|uniref:Hypothetical_protein n=1 Tax=Hexamita inflata TaxID=28002 RepID=A0AA86PM43_9EUKA|nr:Hypothetical protein HINF_LOCUS30019 [Hexamita inflata]